MGEVKWIKITTDMFDNRKIKHLRKLPEGNNIVLIWVMLLTMAGRCNACGMVFLTENIPYNARMLADELDFEESTIKLALDALAALGMISVTPDLYITGWDEYQNIDGLEKIREQTRERVARHREKKLLSSNVTSNVTVTQCNATDIEEEKEIEIDNKRKAFSPPSVDDVRSYCNEQGICVDADAFVDFYESKGWMVGKNKMKNWKSACKNWSRRNKDNNKFNNFTQREYDHKELERKLLGL